MKDTIIHGGLHSDDYDYAEENTPKDYELVEFRLSPDGYHFQAVYERRR